MTKVEWDMTGLVEESVQKKASATVSCRFDRTLYEVLRKDSKGKGISLNSLINSILKRYIAWEKYAIEIGFIPLAKETVSSIFDELDEVKMQQIADRLGRTLPRELILLMFNRIDFHSIIAFLEITLSRYGTVQHNIDGNTHEFIIRHNVNKKFSSFLAEVARVMGEDLSLNLSVDVDSKIISIRIKETAN